MNARNSGFGRFLFACKADEVVSYLSKSSNSGFSLASEGLFASASMMRPSRSISNAY